MDPKSIEGVTLTPLKIIGSDRGSVLHALKKGDPGYVDFGEAYFSTVNHGLVKGWKNHKRMTLNLAVPVGAIKFVMFDARPASPTRGKIQEVELSLKNYFRLTIPPGVWMAFQGVGEGTNLLINIADIKHDPAEGETLPLKNFTIPYNHWELEPKAAVTK